METKTIHSLKIIHWNCFKMTQTRLIEFKIFLNSEKPDIVSIQEIKMNQEEGHLYLRFDGYVTSYKARERNPEFGGGTAILVADSVAHMVIGLEKNLDHVGVRIETNDFCFSLISLYAPSNTLNFDTIRKYCELGSELFLMGDLNAKTKTLGCKSLDKNGRVLEEILSSELDLCILNDESPTYFRHRNECSELLDLFLCSSRLATNVFGYEVLTEYLMGSDHAPIMCTLQVQKSFRLETKNTKLRLNFNKAEWDNFGRVGCLDWTA